MNFPAHRLVYICRMQGSFFFFFLVNVGNKNVCLKGFAEDHIENHILSNGL